MTKTRNPWNFIIPTLKVSVTKVQGFFDLREFNFQTSFLIGCSWNKMMKIRGDRNAKSTNLIIPIDLHGWQKIAPLRMDIVFFRKFFHMFYSFIELIWVRPYTSFTPYIQKHSQIPYLLTTLQNHLLSPDW